MEATSLDLLLLSVSIPSILEEKWGRSVPNYDLIIQTFLFIKIKNFISKVYNYYCTLRIVISIYLYETNLYKKEQFLKKV
jgi:hypothetical protein